MAKTRRQSLTPVVKKEECEVKTKSEKMFQSPNNATKTSNRITKNRKPIQAQITKTKSENIEDNKALLASPKKTFTASMITTEKITKLIGYIVDNKMSVLAASRKVGISPNTAYSYYQDYKEDPKHRIPLPKTRSNKRSTTETQQKIEDLIHYIVNDGMNVTRAAKKACMHRYTAIKYYAKYLEDPEQKTPSPDVCIGNTPKRYTQEEITDLIGYIVRDKMTVVEASKKVNMSHSTARKYYLKYLHNPNRVISYPHKSNQRHGLPCTNDQVSSLIRYIVNDGMTLLESSIKANMNSDTARRYYKQYLNDPENKIPTPENSDNRVAINSHTLVQVKNFFCYVITDKLNITQAACKAKIARSSGWMYYNKYLKSPHNQSKRKDTTYSVEKMKQLVELLQNDKMSLAKAADIVHLDYSNAKRYYKQYLKNPENGFHTIKCKQYTREDIKSLIECIERHKLSVCAAAKRVKINIRTAYKYYAEYRNDPEHKVPIPNIKRHTIKKRTINKYTQIISDIYNNNPSIKPIHGCHQSEVDDLLVNIKQESAEEDKNMIIKTEIK